jgi:deazaflavin-dependent oxidoreductase (nitroreductase family)
MRAARALARFNRSVVNPIQKVYATHLPPFAVVTHVGRRSGRTYRTPVLAFRSGTTLAVVLFYGNGTDWIRNVLAQGSATITRRGADHSWTGLHIVEPSAPGVPSAARVLGRLAGAVVVGELS